MPAAERRRHWRFGATMNETGFTTFAKRERAGLLAFFARRGVPRGDAEDLVQETLLAFWNLRARARAGKERSFLYGIAHRRLMAYRRKQARRAAVLVQGLPKDAIEPPSANGYDALPFMPLLVQEEAERLREILARLPKRQRDTIQSMYFDGRTERATANALGISRDTVRTHHRRALEWLRTFMTAEEDG